jgi:hypothetical protein
MSLFGMFGNLAFEALETLPKKRVKPVAARRGESIKSQKRMHGYVSRRGCVRHLGGTLPA